MKKEKILLLIILILVVLVICIVGLIVLLRNRTDSVVDSEEGNTERIIVSNLTIVEDRNDFYAVQSCVEKFYTYYTEIFDEEFEGYFVENDEQKEKIIADRAEKIYNMLDEEYIEYEEITLENLASKLQKMTYTSIIISNMYYIEKNERIAAYLVYGSINDGTLNSEPINLQMMVKIDYVNRTFKILLGEQVNKYYEKLKNGQKLEIEDEEIANKIYNTFTYEYVIETEYVKDLFAHYKKAVRIDKEYSYEMLNEHYKKVCFEDFDNYLSYLDSNYSRIASARLDEYEVEENGNYSEYTFKDTNGNYYIFKETAPFKYTVTLDNYVIPTDDFKEQYNSSSDAKKVVLNIKKFFMAIDDKNYGYAYNVLAESFKNNKYPTKNDFISFVKENFFEKNEINFVSYETESGTYVYKINLTDATEENSTKKTFNIIVRLGSGTDFQMSFGTN